MRRVLKMLAGDDSVAAEVILEFTTPGGTRIRDEELHLWTLDAEGKSSGSGTTSKRRSTSRAVG